MELREWRGEAGFTLLEIMFALVVLLVGILGIFGLLNSSILLNRETAETSKATHFAQKRLEAVRNTPFDAIASCDKYASPVVSAGDATLNPDDGNAVTELANLGLSGTVKWKRDVTTIGSWGSGENLLRVVVSVSWGGTGDASRSVQLVTYVSRSGLNNTSRYVNPPM